ncbi:phospholipase [Kocuria coralli]|uniref:Phospholipase n=1 Tax=Kocuria coralli TaxID=1461025 RepID=A0A5J5KWL3_9MICC|nr:phospholipase [Kocuria coralli]KAA9393798.1 phospholipase [Kocuria coralli]
MSETPVVEWNRDPAASPEAPLLVLFHGFGADEKDLMGLVPGLPSEFLVASVRAPQREGYGYRWYPLHGDDAFDPVQVTAALEPLIEWLRELAAGRESVSLLGFSQGMSVATSLVRAMPGAIDAVIGLSGFTLPEPLPFFRDEELEKEPFKLFWGRDPQDPVVNDLIVNLSAEWLLTHADTTKVQYQGMGHGVSPQELRHVNEYLTHYVLKAEKSSPRG